MIKQNPLCWNTTGVENLKYLYLTIMRDLKAYCAKGYCEVSIVFYRFCSLPNSLIKRELAVLPPALRKERLIVNWEEYESVRYFLTTMVKIASEVNHVKINPEEFAEAFNEFTQYLQKRMNHVSKCSGRSA